MLRQPGQPALHTTKAFSAWFGQSQVTDADGNPQVVYHGSPARKGHPAFGTHGNHTPVITAGRPFFVTDDLTYAEKFARGGHVQALYVRLINPVDLSDPAQCERLVKVFNADPAVLLTRGPWDEDFEGDIADSAYFLLESPAVMELLKDEGFDGARVPEDIELGVESFAVFAPGQLKAADCKGDKNLDAHNAGLADDIRFVPNLNTDTDAGTGPGESAQNIFMPDQFQTKMLAAQDLADRVRSTRQRLSINSDGSIKLYHATSRESMASIASDRQFKGNTWFAASKAAAMLQARPKHGKDTGCLVINVNPQDIEFSTGTGEFYAPEGLSLSEDGCWISSRSKDEAQSDESLPAPAP